MAANVGSLMVEIGANVARLQRDLGKARSEINTFSRRAESHFAGVQRAGESAYRAMAAMASAVAVKSFTHSIIEAGSRFEQTMATVRGVSRAAKADFVLLSRTARDMGRETEFSASQAAEGLQYLAMAGFSAKQAAQALPGVLNLATAGQVDLGRAADIASNALTSMRLEIQDLDRVSDVLVKTITTSNTNMEMMAESFKYAAPSAAGYGYSVEQLSAMIGLLGNAGIQGSMAGTQLAAAFTDAGKVFEHYKVKAGEGTKYTNDLTGALTLLQEKGAGASDVMRIFGERGGRAVLSLMAAGIPAIQDYVKRIESAEGSTRELSEIMRGTASSAFRELSSAVESVQIAAFESETGELNRTFRELAKTIRENESSLAEVASSFIKIAQGAATAAGWTVSFFNALGTGLGELAGRMVYGRTMDDDVADLEKRAASLRGSLDGMKQGNNPLFDALPDESKARQIKAVSAELEKVNKELRLTRTFQELASNPLQIKADIPEIKNIAAAAAGSGSLTGGGSGADGGTGSRSAIKSAPSVADDLVRIQASLTGDINRYRMSETEFARAELARQVAEYRSKYGEIPELARWAAAREAEIRDQEAESERRFLDTMSELSGDRLAVELRRIRDEKDEFIKSGVDRVQAERWAAEAIRQARIESAKDSISGLKRGLQAYLDSAADMAGQTENLVNNAFGSMEDAVAEFARTGKLSFSDLVDSIISDLARMAAKQMFAPLAKSFLSFLPSAHGNVFSDGHLVPMAHGGLITRPAIFPLAQGAALAGEAGTEAIMPLGRTPSGDLGVKVAGAGGGSPRVVQVEIVNQSGQPVKASKGEASFNMDEMVITIVLDGVENNRFGLRDVLANTRR